MKMDLRRLESNEVFAFPDFPPFKKQVKEFRCEATIWNPKCAEMNPEAPPKIIASASLFDLLFGASLFVAKVCLVTDPGGGSAGGADVLKLCKMLNYALGFRHARLPCKQRAADWLRHCRRPLICDRWLEGSVSSDRWLEGLVIGCWEDR